MASVSFELHGFLNMIVIAAFLTIAILSIILATQITKNTSNIGAQGNTPTIIKEEFVAKNNSVYKSCIMGLMITGLMVLIAGAMSFSTAFSEYTWTLVVTGGLSVIIGLIYLINNDVHTIYSFSIITAIVSSGSIGVLLWYRYGRTWWDSWEYRGRVLHERVPEKVFLERQEALGGGDVTSGSM